MARIATIPAAADTLCEGCGYVLNGLQPDGRCPECGKPLAESVAGLRHPPAWELSGGGNRFVHFLRTSADSIFRPSTFFRGLSIHPNPASLYFAHLHWFLGSALFGAAAWAHMDWSGTWFGDAPDPFRRAMPVVLVALAYAGTAMVNRLAARLTTWEAAYRGIRLPLLIVRRGLHYHAAHYLPVGVLMAGIIFGYRYLVRRYPYTVPLYATTYLYVLCGAVVLSAFYLFKTYWTAMRNLMYANG